MSTAESPIITAAYVEDLRRQAALYRLLARSLQTEVDRLKYTIHSRSTCTWCGNYLNTAPFAALVFTESYGVYCSKLCDGKSRDVAQ